MPAPTETTTPPVGNDNQPAPADAVSLADLAAASGQSEDDLLARIAAILARREQETPDA